ncbi:hypothetical protein FRB90_009777 [Tulasnella sp. 427]|nr:hypothetical protein FRB90_009777 [Tulasnella sp. 427]
MMEKDQSLLSKASRTSAHAEKPYSFSKLIDQVPPATPIPTQVLRLRSRVLHLFWLFLVALIVGCVGVSVMQQDAMGSVISKVGTCMSSPSAEAGSEMMAEEIRRMPWDSSLYLRGEPTESFADNLRPENQYITSWTYAGWTNDFMAFSNLIYLGMISSRIPIIPPFPPSLSHIGKGGKYINYGEVFDLPRLRQRLRLPILEWRDVKQDGTPIVDTLGCWSIWAGMTSAGAYMRNTVVNHLNLDVSYTSIPPMPLVNDSSDPHVSFWGLSSLLFPKGRKAALNSPISKNFPSPIRNTTIEPNEQLACFDIMYFVGAKQPFEWEESYSPAWRFVGTHVHWTPYISNLAEAYVRKALELSESDSIPYFITLHVRRGDFAKMCGDTSVDKCMPSLAAFARRVQEIKDKLRILRSLAVERVIITSDEKDPAWWDEVKALGWTFFDHEQEETASKYGKW